MFMMSNKNDKKKGGFLGQANPDLAKNLLKDVQKESLTEQKKVFEKKEKKVETPVIDKAKEAEKAA
jgi:hypothetical protein